jgi:hypothetical protein
VKKEVSEMEEKAISYTEFDGVDTLTVDRGWMRRE